jgi:hypothetical protein
MGSDTEYHPFMPRQRSYSFSFSGGEGGLAFSAPGNYTEVLLERSHVRVGASPLFCWRKERRLRRTALVREAPDRSGARISGLAGRLD